ncbi:hypothetical protein ACFQY7_02600 [Actinomadura luteofluorescens]|uniref:hypothetical protein n=1 Tax=Actinomadura luteofluorescens TaxID=46163 RepID=UPI00362A15AC
MVGYGSRGARAAGPRRRASLLDRALGPRGQPLAPGTVVSVGTERDGARPVTFSVTSPAGS